MGKVKNKPHLAAVRHQAYPESKKSPAGKPGQSVDAFMDAFGDTDDSSDDSPASPPQPKVEGAAAARKKTAAEAPVKVVAKQPQPADESSDEEEMDDEEDEGSMSEEADDQDELSDDGEALEEDDDDHESNEELDRGDGSEDDESEIEDEETMARDMEQLKHTDPEFYAFLKQDEPSLLDFKPTEDLMGGGHSDEDDDEEEDGGEFDENDMASDEDLDASEGSEGASGEEPMGTDDDGDSDMDGGRRTGPQQAITKEMVKDWERRVFEQHSVEALKQLLDAFRAAVHMNDPEEEDEPLAKGKRRQRSFVGKGHYRYKIDNSAAFNALIVLCLTRMQEALDHHVKVPAAQEGRRPPLASKGSNWRKFKNIARGYIANLLHFVRQLVDPAMLGFALKSVERMAPYYASCPKIGRSLLKTCVDIWGKGEEHVRVMAFLTVRKLALVAPKTYLDTAIRALYMMYAKNAKFTSAQSHPTLVFMENCVVEIAGVDAAATYPHAFVYIRQLAIHLRSAMTTRKTDAFASVYNWQYLHCLQLWCRVVSEHFGPTLAPLTYPLTQVLIGTIRMIPTARYFPLRFHAIRSLNQLSRATRTFIPVAPMLLEVVDSQYVKGKTKKGVSKPPLFPYIYKVSKSMLGTKVFQEGCVDQVTGLLLEHLAVVSTHIAFPEYAVPTVVQLKTFLATCKNPKAKAQLKQILDKAKESIAFTAAERRQVEFGAKDAKQVVDWNRRMAERKTPLIQYSESWNKIEKARQAAFEAVSGRGGEDDEESEDDFADGAAVAAGGEHRMDEDESYSEDDAPRAKAAKAKGAAQKKAEKPEGSRSSKKMVFNSDDEDDVEDEVADFRFSDSD